MKICLVTLGLYFSGNSLKTGALGGSESALAYIAKELYMLGHDVTVFCNCTTPGYYDQVKYNQITENSSGDFDVLIVSRFAQLNQIKGIKAKKRILWCHDTDIAGVYENFIETFDLLFVMSKFQKGVLSELYNIPDSKFYLTSNGFDLNLVQKGSNNRNSFIYASRPERGLAPLLFDIWPKVLELNTDAVLYVCGYSHDGSELCLDKVQHPITGELAEPKNIVCAGKLNKANFYKLLSECGWMLYPTVYPEISCISAIEAQANGCVVVSTDAFAMPETVKTDTLIKQSPDYVEVFLEKLQNHYVIPDMVDDYAWYNIAKRWENLLES